MFVGLVPEAEDHPYEFPPLRNVACLRENLCMKRASSHPSSTFEAAFFNRIDRAQQKVSFQIYFGNASGTLMFFPPFRGLFQV